MTEERAFDPYQKIDWLISETAKSGETSLSEALREGLVAGATASEIFMHLRHVMADALREPSRLPDDTKTAMAELVSYFDTVLSR